MGKSVVALPELPVELRTESFRSAWVRFQQHRKEIGKPLRPTGAGALLDRLVPYGPVQAAELLDRAVVGGWQGVIFKDTPGPRKSSNQLDQQQRIDKQRTAELIRERERHQEEKLKRIGTVATLSPERREKARTYFAAKQPNEVARRAMLKADPLGGGTLTDLIYQELKAREKT